jgi:predicted cobalt transporter CbtA
VTPTYGAVLKRALLAGVLVGIALGVYVLVVVEPVITDAIVLEERLSDVHTQAELVVAHTHGDDALVSRRGQLAGGFVASVALSVIVAGVFGTLFAAVRHRLPGRTVGFVSVALIPGLKYPANPPAVGDAATVGERSVQWLSLVIVSMIAVFFLSRLSVALRSRIDDAARCCFVAVASIGAFGALLALYPSTPDSISPDVPAALVWDFRLRSLGSLVLLWGGIGAGFGLFMNSLTQRDTATVTVTPDVYV